MVLSAATAGAHDTRTAGAAVDFRRFHEEHYDLVWRVLVRFGAPPADVEDLAQEVFTIVHRKLPGFRADANVRTWLFAICRKVASGARRRARFRSAALQLFGLVRPTAVPAPEPGVRADLERLLRRLPEVQRVTLLLHEVDGMSPSEIAELYGCPEPTVWSRLRAAKKTLERGRR